MRRRSRATLPIMALSALLWAPFARAGQDQPGDFDYYVLALSWSPGWCARTGDADGSPQCDAGRGLGWVLHGLWPQYDTGWPQDCRSGFEPPSRAATAEMSDIMGSGGSAWHQWRKHGSCTGLDPAEYFDTAREAYDAIVRPQEFRRLDRAIRLPAALVEEAFLRDNPGLAPDGVTITCRDGAIQEVRICLSRDLEPRICGADVVRDCSLGDALMTPIR